jgi:cobalamin biosynthesis protein CobD/CbiB
MPTAPNSNQLEAKNLIVKGMRPIVLSTLLSLLLSLSLNYFNIVFANNWWWSLVFFLFLFSASRLLHSLKSSPETSTEIAIGTIGFKVLLLMVAIFLYSIIDRKELYPFSMHFLAHYVLFTVFEIRYLLLLSKIKS